MKRLAIALLLVGCGQADELRVQDAIQECRSAGTAVAVHYGTRTEVECVQVPPTSRTIAAQPAISDK